MNLLVHILVLALMQQKESRHDDDFYLLGNQTYAYLISNKDDRKSPILSELTLVAIGKKEIVNRIGVSIRYRAGKYDYLMNISGVDGERKRFLDALNGVNSAISYSQTAKVDSLIFKPSEAWKKLDTATTWKTTRNPYFVLKLRHDTMVYPVSIKLTHFMQSGDSQIIGNFPTLHFTRLQAQLLAQRISDSTITAEKIKYIAQMQQSDSENMFCDKIELANWTIHAPDFMEVLSYSYRLVGIKTSYFIYEHFRTGDIIAVKREKYLNPNRGDQLIDLCRYIRETGTYKYTSASGFDESIPTYEVLDRYINGKEKYLRKLPNCK